MNFERMFFCFNINYAYRTPGNKNVAKPNTAVGIKGPPFIASKKNPIDATYYTLVPRSILYFPASSKDLE